MRDRDIRNAIKDELDATGQFSDTFVSGLPEDKGYGASELETCVIEPESHRYVGHSDDIPSGVMVANNRAIITIIVRDGDPQVRDEKAERLMNVVKSTLNGNKLGSLVVPGHSYVSEARWRPAVAPERRIMVIFSYQFLENGWASSDTEA